MKIRFFHDLSGLLSRKIRGADWIDYSVTRRASIKDIVEALGLPHTDVGGILVNSNEVDFSFLPEDSDRAEIYPLMPPVDVRRPTVLRPDPFPDLRFIVDANVGKLAPLLRLIGCDAAADFSLTDEDLAEQAFEEKRVLLSRDRGLLKRKKITYGYLLRSEDANEQFIEVARMFGLQVPEGIDSPHCMYCNGNLVEVEKSAILHLLQPLTRKYYDEFYQCESCQKIFWPGSHTLRMNRWLEETRKLLGQ